MNKFKVGDTVEVIDLVEAKDAVNDGIEVGDVLTVNYVDNMWCAFEGCTFWISSPGLRLLDPTNPRPHAELIKQWADDDTLEIEVKNGQHWTKVARPNWLPELKYQIKPTKPTEKEAARKRLAVMEAELQLLKTNIDNMN